MYSYAFKRFIRSWSMFLALFLGVTLATTLFSGTLVGADAVGHRALGEALGRIPFDVLVHTNAKNISSETIRVVRNSVGSINYVDQTDLILRISGTASVPSKNFSAAFNLVGIQNSSPLYQEDIIKENASGFLGVNETYIDEDSINAGDLGKGDVITFQVQVYEPGPPIRPHAAYSFNLTVAGFVSLSDQAFSAAAGQYPQFFRSIILGGGIARRRSYNLLIVNDETFLEQLNHIYNQSLLPTGNVAVNILVHLDHESAVSPWDIDRSIEETESVNAQILNKVRIYNYNSFNLLALVLGAIQTLSSRMQFGFIILALPVFFTAWYMGVTVSEVSFNLRRKEIGLLSTKGFTKNQVFRLFLTEASLLGLIAGALGAVVGVLLLPLVNIGAELLYGFSFLGIETIVLTLIFSVAISILSVFQPARRASSLSVVEALREYAPSEGEKPFKRRWPLLALLLGTYKLVILFFGINLSTTLTPPRGNIFAILLFRTGLFIDQVLGYLAPVLFFWGFSKVFIQGSFRLQDFLGRVAHGVVGDLSRLATESARRNVRRTASIAFLVALIVGYGVSVVGALASSQDFILRSINNNVGADAAVWLFSGDNVTSISGQIGNLSEVSSVAVERWFYAETSFGTIQVRAIDPSNWTKTAYYEDAWFTGNSLREAFEDLSNSNETILLDKVLAEDYDISVDQNISATMGSEIYTLKVVGFFGPGGEEGGVQPGGGTVSYWSYIPDKLYNQTSGVSVLVTRILVKLVNGANGTAVAEEISSLSDDIERVDSVAEQLNLVEDNIFLSGPRRIQQLGIPFAVLTSSIGVVLVTTVTLRERKKEITLMAIRGLSFKQLVQTLLMENLGMITFSILLGLLVGYVITSGNVATLNVSPSLVMRRTVFPLDSLLTLVFIFATLLSSAILPILCIAKLYSTKLEWRLIG